MFLWVLRAAELACALYVAKEVIERVKIEIYDEYLFAVLVANKQVLQRKIAHRLDPFTSSSNTAWPSEGPWMRTPSPKCPPRPLIAQPAVSPSVPRTDA